MTRSNSVSQDPSSFQRIRFTIYDCVHSAADGGPRAALVGPARAAQLQLGAGLALDAGPDADRHPEKDLAQQPALALLHRLLLPAPARPVEEDIAPARQDRLDLLLLIRLQVPEPPPLATVSPNP